MSYKYDDANTRKQIANFSVDEWIGFRERLDELIKLGELSERDEKILTELIVKMKSTAQLGYLAKTDDNYSWLKSNQGKPMSTRRIQQILTEYFPEFHIQTTHKKEHKNQKLRNELPKIREVMITEDSCCGKCGSKEDLEIHHMFPLELCEDNDDRNLIILCGACHQRATNHYQAWLKKLKKEIMDNSNKLASNHDLVKLLVQQSKPLTNSVPDAIINS